MTAIRAGLALVGVGDPASAARVWTAARGGTRLLDTIEEPSVADPDDERLLTGLVGVAETIESRRDPTVDLAGTDRKRVADRAAEARTALAAATGGSVETGAVRRYLAAVADEPTVPIAPPVPTVDGRRVRSTMLSLDALGLAAAGVAAGRDDPFVGPAVTYARVDATGDGEPDRDLATPDATGGFDTLLLDYVAEPRHRRVIARRLDERVDRRRAREGDAAGLFD
ncbi:hypothetical protein BRD17_05400 [Halobacteriales archaeon SW_7_68_16]|nr:MAG: hypothetical protein BRD17_05400 [Halobacteriales archaeon SW_7_68_16]